MIAIRTFRDAENEIRRLRTELDFIKQGPSLATTIKKSELTPEQLNQILQWIINNIRKYIINIGTRDFYMVLGFGDLLEEGIIPKKWPGKVVLDVSTRVKWIEASAQVIIAPSGLDLILDVEFSDDDGQNYYSLFPSGNTNKLIINSGEYIGTQDVFEVLNVYNGALPQVRVLQVGTDTPCGYLCIILRGTIEDI